MSSNNDPPTPSSLFTFKTSKHHIFPTTANNNNDEVIPWDSMRQAFQSFLASSSDKTSFFSRFTTTSNNSSQSLMSPMFSSHHPHHTIQNLNSLFFRNSSDSATIGANNHESSNSSSGGGNGNDDNDAKAKSSEIHNYWDYKQPHHFEFDNVTTTRKIFSIAATVFFGYMCKAWMKLFHTITFINRESFEDLVWVHWLNLQRIKREAAAASSSSLTEHGEQQENKDNGGGQEQQELTESHVKVPGLLTVLNHASMMDEPFLFANLIPSTWYFNPEILRSPICAADQCFANFVFAEVAKTLRILPMQRGGSINQSAMDIAINKLSSGHWISVFPEGYIKQDGEIHTIRRGVGKLILDSDPTPRVYPIYHRGMEGVKSERKWLPSFGAHVVVKLGREIRFDDLIEDFKNGKTNQDDTYILIANRIQKKLNDLKKEVDEYREQHNIRNKAEDEV